MTERRYALTKLGPGDYLLPSNDALDVHPTLRPDGAGWLYRFLRWEDGPELGAELRRTLWSVRRVPFRLHGGLLDLADVEELPWVDIADKPTRAAAIDFALALDDAPPARAHR